eukprot:188426_1
MSGEHGDGEKRDRKRRKLSDKDEGEDPKGEDIKQISTPPIPDNYDDFLELFECPVCNVSMFNGPILQCPEGHIICQKCKANLPNPKICPQCRKALGNCRNRVLEVVADKMPMPCKNKDFGCPLIVSKSDRIEHAEQCKFAQLECPYDCLVEKSARVCKWAGSIQQLDCHWKETHADTDFLEFEDSEEINWKIDSDQNEDFSEDGEWILLARVAEHRFVIFVQTSSDYIRMRVLHVGNEAFGHCKTRFILKNEQSITYFGPIQSYTEQFDAKKWFSVHPSLLDPKERNDNIYQLSFPMTISL